MGAALAALVARAEPGGQAPGVALPGMMALAPLEPVPLAEVGEWLTQARQAVAAPAQCVRWRQRPAGSSPRTGGCAEAVFQYLQPLGPVLSAAVQAWPW